MLSCALDASVNDSNSSSKYLESTSLPVDDTMAASFQVDRASMVTDETLEIDVAKLTSSHSRRHTSKSSCKSSCSTSTHEAAAAWSGALDRLDVEPPASQTSQTLVSERKHGDGKVERVFADGKKLLIFSNGTRKWSQASSTPKTWRPRALPLPRCLLPPCIASSRHAKQACNSIAGFRLLAHESCRRLVPVRATLDRQRGVSGRRKRRSLLQQRC